MLIVLIIIIVLLIGGFILIYNQLVSSRQDVNQAWSDIDVQLKRRHDLIPNLVEMVKGYAAHESAVFVQIAEIRSRAISLDPNDISQKSTTEKELENNLHQILAIGENYPELKASDNFQKLQQTLTDTEDEIASARRIYNENVASYNTKIAIFPYNLIANLNHFLAASYFQNQ